MIFYMDNTENQMDLADLARRLGVAEIDLPNALLPLARDVAGDDDISDAHPRFDCHFALLGWASDAMTDTQDLVDQAAQAPDPAAATNGVTRTVLGRIGRQMVGWK